MNRILNIGVGIICCSLGISILFIYLNLFVFGFNFFEYLFYVLKTFEFYLLPVGIFLLLKK